MIAANQSPGERGLLLFLFGMSCGTLWMTLAQPLSVWGVGCPSLAEPSSFLILSGYQLVPAEVGEYRGTRGSPGRTDNGNP